MSAIRVLLALALLLAPVFSNAGSIITVGFGGTVTLDDSYSESNDVPGAEAFLSASYATEAGQCFTSGGGELDSAKFYLKKDGSPTGNATAKVYAHSGTYGTSSIPTGAALATSDNFDVATLTTSMQLVTLSFTGANRITLSATYYCVDLAYAGGGETDYVMLGNDTSSPSHGGNAFDNYGGWTAQVYDGIFYVYAVR
jgi:hypothetical protein